MSSTDALLIAGVLGQSTVLGANLFEYVVVVPNWRQPGGVAAYRALMRRRHPGHFFQTLVPATVVALLAALVVTLLTDGPAVLIATALATVVVAEAFTLLYFMPRNRALFLAPVEAEPGARSMRLVNEWAVAAAIRIVLIAVGVLASLVGLVVH
jgi:hypothetical protein